MILIYNLLLTIPICLPKLIKSSNISDQSKVKLVSDNTYIDIIILMLFDLKKAGDWGLVQYCKKKNIN